jgi:hypothetical protein
MKFRLHASGFILAGLILRLIFLGVMYSMLFLLKVKKKKKLLLSKA